MEYIIVVVENMLILYQFRPNTEKQAGGVLFVIEGFKNWKKKENLQSCGAKPTKWSRSTMAQKWQILMKCYKEKKDNRYKSQR